MEGREPPGRELNGASPSIHSGRHPVTLRSTSPWFWLPAGFFCLAFALELAAILVLNRGVLTYTLDDPYLHLALAENLGAGHYGLDRTDHSAPSSSILWPYLLAPFAASALGAWLPLVINLIASIGIVALYQHVAGMALAGVPAAKRDPGIAIGTLFLILATNLLGLAFTGMEHSLQVLLSVGLAIGLIHEHRTQAVPWWLAPVIVLGPLIRYENLALSLPAVIYLAWRRHRAVAALCVIALVLGMGGFSLFLRSIGLEWLPLSVLSKSQVADRGASLGALVDNLKANLRPGAFLLVGGLLLVIGALSRNRNAQQALAAWAVAAIVLHLFGGRFGWFARYEVYAWATALIMLIYLERQWLARRVERGSPIRLAAALALVLAVACGDYLRASAITPLAANNIFEQHAQMRRFVTEYHRAAVAANDLGLISYRNDRYVLDLDGLASKETRDARRAATGTEWMNALAARHGVRFAMVYSAVFPAMPENWIPLGGLHLGRSRITPGDSIVTFLALDPATADSVRKRLMDFRRTLPPGVRFVFADESD